MPVLTRVVRTIKAHGFGGTSQGKWHGILCESERQGKSRYIRVVFAINTDGMFHGVYGVCSRYSGKSVSLFEIPLKSLPVVFCFFDII